MLVHKHYSNRKYNSKTFLFGLKKNDLFIAQLTANLALKLATSLSFLDCLIYIILNYERTQLEIVKPKSNSSLLVGRTGTKHPPAKGLYMHTISTT